MNIGELLTDDIENEDAIEEDENEKEKNTKPSSNSKNPSLDSTSNTQKVTKLTHVESQKPKKEERKKEKEEEEGGDIMQDIGISENDLVDNEEEIELTEDDLNNPELLAQLKSISGDVHDLDGENLQEINKNEEKEEIHETQITNTEESMELEQETQKKMEQSLQEIPTEKKQTPKDNKRTTAFENHSEIQSPPKKRKMDSANTIHELNQAIRDEKEKALTAKKTGNTQTAVSHIKNMKQLQSKLESLKTNEPEEIKTQEVKVLKTIYFRFN